MTLEGSPVQVADLVHTIASNTTCTQDTVDSLKNLLSSNNEEPVNIKRGLAVRQTKERAHNAGAGKTTGNNSRKKPGITILEEFQDKRLVLSSRERNRIATQVVNSTLKSLTAALKDSTLARTPKSKRAATKTIGNRISDVDRDLEPAVPLEPRSVNRISNSPDKKISTRCLDVNSKKHGSGLMAQAQCACIAFAALRDLQPGNSSNKDAVCAHLENGVSALIGKLIALGFHDLAVEELALLKLRLDGARPPEKNERSRVAKETSAEVLLHLLQCSEKAATGSNLSITVSLQLHVLRVIAARPTGALVEGVLRAVQPASRDSLVELIERQLSIDLPGARERAIHQLNSLTHFLLGFCSQASKGDDGQHSKSKSTVGPHTTFALQSLALQLRVAWWKMALHQGDVATEIWGPFTRSLGSFGQSPASSNIERYRACKHAFETLLRHVQSYDKKATAPFGLQVQALVEVYRKMATLARDCSTETDVRLWWKEATILLINSKASRFRILSIKCRSAAAHLTAPPCSRDDKELLNQLSLIFRELDGDIPDDLEDLEDLLLSINSIRRAITLFNRGSHSAATTATGRIQDSIHGQCDLVLVKGIRFLLQCLESINARLQETSTYERTVELLQSVAGPYVESLVALAKCCCGDTVRWDRLDVGFQECIRVATSLECMVSPLRTANIGSWTGASLRASIANAYWCRFLYLKNIQAEPNALMQVLNVSITQLDNSPFQEAACLLPARLEQQGILHEAEKTYPKAADCYRRALHGLVATGSLAPIAEAAAVQPPSQISGDRGRWPVLKRLLGAYLNALTCIGDKQTLKTKWVFDDDNLPIAERGLLLEQQLAISDVQVAAECSNVDICEAIRTTASTIMSIYSKEAYPIRRLRAVNQLLRMYLARPSTFSPNFQRVLCEPIELTPEGVRLSLDAGLQQYRAHLMASREIYISLCTKAVSREIVRESLAAWSSLLGDKPNNDLIHQCVDDVQNYLLQLECLTEYLEGHNLIPERLSALKLLSKSYEISRPLQAAKIVILLSELGIQYIRLENPSEAGLALHKAQKYLDINGTDKPSLVECRWRFSYAEYLLTIGNIETRSVVSVILSP